MAIGSISLVQLASGPVNSTLTVSTGRPQAPINNLRASLSLGKNGRATAAATVSTASILVVPVIVSAYRGGNRAATKMCKTRLGQRSDPAPHQRRRDLGEMRALGGAELHDVLVWHQPSEFRHRGRQQPDRAGCRLPKGARASEFVNSLLRSTNSLIP
jgi:hypothetical protein